MLQDVFIDAFLPFFITFIDFKSFLPWNGENVAVFKGVYKIFK